MDLKTELRNFYQITKNMDYDSFEVLTHDENLEREERDFFYLVQEYFLQKRQEHIIQNQRW